jgi:uncharacterized SAM-binding protein YcdF (DUF218 family)
LTPLILPINFIIFFLIISFFFKRLKKIFNFFLFLLVFISIFPVGDFLTYHFLNKNFLNGKNNKDFDAVLILGGNEKRILYAFSLLEFNPNTKIFFSGENDERRKFNFLTKNMFDQKQTIILDRSRNTYENLVKFKKFQTELSFKNTIVVSDIWHYKRVLKISKKLNLSLKPFYYQGSDNNFNFFPKNQSFDFAGNLLSFNRFFREIYGILAIIII